MAQYLIKQDKFPSGYFGLGVSPIRVTLILIFLLIAFMEMPLSLLGYSLEPEASLVERVIVAASFGLVSYLIGRQIYIQIFT